MCPFDECLIRLTHQLLSYDHAIVMTAMLQSNTNDVNTLNYITMEEISRRTGMHSRDTLRYVCSLEEHKFLKSFSKIYDSKRVTFYGIDYFETFDFVLTTLHIIKSRLTDDQCFWCKTCRKMYSIYDCLFANENWEVKCPIDNSHETVHKDSYESQHYAPGILELIDIMKSLKNKTPEKKVTHEIYKNVV